MPRNVCSTKIEVAFVKSRYVYSDNEVIYLAATEDILFFNLYVEVFHQS